MAEINNNGNNNNTDQIREIVEEILNNKSYLTLLDNKIIEEMKAIKQELIDMEGRLRKEYLALIELINQRKIGSNQSKNNKFPEENKFSGKIVTGLEWDIFLYHFRIFHPNPDKTDLSLALKEGAYTIMCAIDIEAKMTFDQIIEVLRQIYQRSPENVRRDFTTFTQNKSINSRI